MYKKNKTVYRLLCNSVFTYNTKILYNVILSKNYFLKCSSSQDKNDEGKQGGEIILPLDYVIKEELLNKGNICMCCRRFYVHL